MPVTDSGTPDDPDKRVSLREPPAPGGQAVAPQVDAPPAVEVRGISKDFGSNRALDTVDLRIGNGEVLGLPDLTGTALHAASTLNGAMVGKA